MVWNNFNNVERLMPAFVHRSEVVGEQGNQTMSVFFSFLIPFPKTYNHYAMHMIMI
jgi:hypothetical protein